jgi:hypothetical protein
VDAPSDRIFSDDGSLNICSCGIFDLPTCHKSSVVHPNSYFHHYHPSIETGSFITTPIPLKVHGCLHIHTPLIMPRVSRHNPAAGADSEGIPPAQKKSQKSSNTSGVTKRAAATKQAAPPADSNQPQTITANRGKRGKQLVSLLARKSPRRPGSELEEPSQQKLPPLVESQRSTRNSRAKKRETHDDLLGAANSQETIGTVEEVIDLSSEVAAAASTSVYHSKYGGDNLPSPVHTEASSSGFDENTSCGAASDDDSKDRDYKPDGLKFSDDEDFLVDVETESEDERLRSSFPKDTRRKNIIPGGPQPPDLLTYPESDRDKVWNDYVVERRKYSDEACNTRMKSTKSISLLSSMSFCGWQNEQLRPMSEVETNRLDKGQTLKSKDVLQLRIAEEANL